MTKRTVSQIQQEISLAESELKNLHGTKTEVYARIVGYYRALGNWNNGKRAEFSERKHFVLNNNSSAEKAKTCIPTENSTDTVSNSSITYELYTRRTCPNCPPVKSFMESVSIPGKNIDVDTEEGLSEAAKKGVFAAPTVIIYNADGTESARAHSTEELHSIFSSAKIA